MNKKLLREYVRHILNEKAFIGNMNARAYFDTWDTAFQLSGDDDVKNVKVQRTNPSEKTPNPPPQYGIRNPTVRLMINLDPDQWKSNSKDEVWKEMAEVTVKALEELPSVKVIDSTPRLLTQGSRTYPSIEVEIGTMKYLIVMNPGFKVTGAGNSGPGEPEMESAGVDMIFLKRVQQGKSWTVIFGDSPNQKFHNVTEIKKWSESTSTGEPKTDILLRTVNGDQINFSLKRLKFPSYEGLSPSRVEAFAGKDSINCVRFLFILQALENQPDAFRLHGENEIIADLEDLGGTQLYPLPDELAIPIVYGTKQTGGPVDYVIKVKGGVSLKGVFDDQAGTITFMNMKIASKNPKIPEGDTPVIAFRTATGKETTSGKSSRRVEITVNLTDHATGERKPFVVVINKVRQMVVPGEQRNDIERASLAANKDVLDGCQSGDIRTRIRVKVQEILEARLQAEPQVSGEDVNDQQSHQDTY